MVPPSPFATRWKLVEFDGRDGLGAVDVDLADAVDGDDGGVLGAPVEHDGLAEVDREGIGGEAGGRSGGGGVGIGPRVLGLTRAVFLVAASDGAESDEGAGQR